MLERRKKNVIAENMIGIMCGVSDRVLEVKTSEQKRERDRKQKSFSPLSVKRRFTETGALKNHFKKQFFFFSFFLMCCILTHIHNSYSGMKWFVSATHKTLVSYCKWYLFSIVEMNSEAIKVVRYVDMSQCVLKNYL